MSAVIKMHDDRFVTAYTCAQPDVSRFREGFRDRFVNGFQDFFERYWETRKH